MGDTLRQHFLSALAVLSGFFLPIQTLALAIGFLLIVDVLTGLWASYKQKQKITSDRLGRTVRKSIVYLLAISVAHIAETHIFGGDIPIVKVVSGFIGSVELLSIYENLSRISGIDFKKVFIEKLMPSQEAKSERGAPRE